MWCPKLSVGSGRRCKPEFIDITWFDLAHMQHAPLSDRPPLASFSMHPCSNCGTSVLGRWRALRVHCSGRQADQYS